MAAFATSADIATLLNITFDDGQTAQADLLLDLATAAIKGWTRQELEYVADDEVKLAGTWSPNLVLPQHPVTAVSSVKVNGIDIAVTGWEWNSRQILRRGGGPRAFDYPAGAAVVGWPQVLDEPLQQSGMWNWAGPDATVDVTYSHGYDVIPEDIRVACIGIALRTFVNPTGYVQEQLGDYSVSYVPRRELDTGLLLTPDDKALLRRYRKWWQ